MTATSNELPGFALTLEHESGTPLADLGLFFWSNQHARQSSPWL